MKTCFLETLLRRGGSRWAVQVVSLLLFLFLIKSASASTDYGPAIWRPCYPSHLYTSGYGHKFHVIHDMEGYYLSTISYFQRSTTQASVHYFTNGKKDYASDAAAGEVSQGVRDSYYAWHARCWNSHSTGTEHEGFVSNPAWYTEAQYLASAGITRHLKNRFGWAMDRNHVIGHDQKRISGWPGYASSNLGVDPYCNSHTDPGAYWSWSHYMDLCKGTVSTPSGPSALTASTASTSQINLKWTDNSGIETQFKVERATSSSGPWTQIGTTSANDVTFSATGLSSGVTYYFRVRASNGSGDSPFSNTANATTSDTVPGAPSALSATAISGSQVNLAWTQGSGNEDGFRIERSSDGVAFSQIATVGINVVSFQNTGLLGNTKYYFRVRSYNTAGNSAYSNIASDTTAPQAPSGLIATATSYNTIALSWTDNASSEGGFKIERATAAAGPFTQIATNSANDLSYSDGGRAGLTAYYYRVRSYNGNGDSAYSNVATVTTPNAPPVLAAIGNLSVTVSTALAFTATATDPNPAVTTTTWATFESYSPSIGNEQVLFKKPLNSGSTDQFIDPAATNYTLIQTNAPAGNGSSHVLKAGWTFLAGQTNPWVRLNTFNTTELPNPTVALDQVVRFKIYASKAVKIGLGLRETGTTAAYGANGGTTGTIDWAGVTNVISGNPIPSHAVAAGSWQTLSFNLPFEPQAAFSGDGNIPQSGVKGVLEHVAISANGGAGAYAVYFDDFAVVAQNTLAYTLDAGAPSGASIERRTGQFTWNPTLAQVGTHTVTARVTDQFGAQDFETFKIIVSVPGGNVPPVLAAIGNKTVNEGSALTFTAAASDADAAQTRTFSLDAGAPAGASIDPTSGAFTWTPSEAQGPVNATITVRVTDNGSPALSDFETVTVTVRELNTAPVLSAITDRTANEGSLLTVTGAASDSDLPANALTYSLEPGAPAGMTVNASGVISWTPSEAQGGETYSITLRVTDNGVPGLYDRKTFAVTVGELNSSPAVTIGSSITTVQTLADFEHNEEGSYSGTVVFRSPSFSSTTSLFLDPSTNAPNLTAVETSFPDPEDNISAKALHVSWTFRSGTTNPWIRLTTFSTSNVYDLPNPTIAFNQKVRFDIRTDKSLKVGLGLRETGTGSPIRGNGGTTGTLEWIGVPSKNGSAPNPSRVVPAGIWTTLEFNLPTETILGALGSGDGVLSSASGKGVLEHLALVPNGGLGTYHVYVDNFEVINTSSTFTVDTGATLTLATSATDPDQPGQQLTFSLNPGAPENAEIDPDTGLFTWTPAPAQSPSTNLITVRVTDDGSPTRTNTASFTVRVNKVNTAPNLEKFDDQAIELDSGEIVSFTASGVDEDLPGDALTYSLVGSVPAGATIHPATGLFSWTPPNVLGTRTLTIRVTDNGSPVLYDEQTVLIEVLPKNGAPSLAAIPDYTIIAGQTVSFTASAGDNDLPAQPLSFALDPDAPITAAIDPATGLFTWATFPSDAGSTNPITVLVEDAPANGAFPKTASRTFLVIVNAPTAASLSGASFSPGEGVRFIVTGDIGASYSIQTSSNLLDWATVTNLTNHTGSIEFIDPSGNNDGQRFYRARWSP